MSELKQKNKPAKIIPLSKLKEIMEKQKQAEYDQIIELVIKTTKSF